MKVGEEVFVCGKIDEILKVGGKTYFSIRIESDLGRNGTCVMRLAESVLVSQAQCPERELEIIKSSP